MHSLEYERKFEVDRNLLPHLPQPWVFIQGYDGHGTGKDVSIRVIPACGTAFLRKKDNGYGVRNKDSQIVSYNTGVKKLETFKGLVVKLRHLVQTPERIWLVDYLPESDTWHAETEFPDRDSFFAEMENMPNWAGKELTWLPEGYTKNFATPKSLREIGSLLDYAVQVGCAEPYDPDSIFGMPVGEV